MTSTKPTIDKAVLLINCRPSCNPLPASLLAAPTEYFRSGKLMRIYLYINPPRADSSLGASS
jgi:hypothetical protein